jgi:hypothetical protein
LIKSGAPEYQALCPQVDGVAVLLGGEFSIALRRHQRRCGGFCTMHMRALAFAGFVSLLVVALPVAGCGSPCEDLDNKICSCEANQTDVDACTAKVNSDKRSATNAEQTRCSQLIDTCTCSALACGNLSACGLAKDTKINVGTQTCQ